MHNADRPLRSPGDFPLAPLPSSHGMQTLSACRLSWARRTAVHQASIGCPFRCQFCGVVPIFDGNRRRSRRSEPPPTLEHLKSNYGIDAVQFYDNNFFLNESHAREQAERMIPLGMRWWAEGRIDTVLRYSDETWRAIRRSGATMIFFGAESGSDEVLSQMNKQITTRPDSGSGGAHPALRHHSGILFRRRQPARTPEQRYPRNHRFIRRIKHLNPDAEIIVQHYIPTPHPDGMYGKIDGKIEFPRRPRNGRANAGTTSPSGRIRISPGCPRRVKRRIDNFELVINSRWPTVRIFILPRWGRVMLQSLSSWRYAFGRYDFPLELRGRKNWSLCASLAGRVFRCVPRRCSRLR